MSVATVNLVPQNQHGAVVPSPNLLSRNDFRLRRSSLLPRWFAWDVPRRDGFLEFDSCDTVRFCLPHV